LHEFHRLKYIFPDKTWGKKAAAAVKRQTQAWFMGQVYFVMDFMPLYPSIIQEYNIDFTTFKDGEERIPQPPPSEVPQGVLRRLIATLVNHRRLVKSLMKNKTASHTKLLQVQSTLHYHVLSDDPAFAVRHQATSSEAYGQQYVWVPLGCEYMTLRREYQG
jgi:DNA polymerase elongation subunit (family B)